MDRLHLKYVMLNKDNVWYRLYYNYATLHAPPPSPPLITKVTIASI